MITSNIRFEHLVDLILIAHDGLSVVGTLLETSQVLLELNCSRIFENEYPTFSHTDVVKSYAVMLCQGKRDFYYLGIIRDDDAFIYA